MTSGPTRPPRRCCAACWRWSSTTCRARWSGSDPEYLHQLRIAVRRSRTVQRQLQGRLPGAGAARLSQRVPLAAAGHRRRPRSRRLRRGARRAGGDAARRRSAAIWIRCGRCWPTAGWSRGPRWRPALRSARAAAAARPTGSSCSRRWCELPLDDRPDAARADRDGDRPRGMRKVYKRVIKLGEAIDDDQPRRGLPRAAQEGQGAALPARAVRRCGCSTRRSSRRRSRR